VTVFTNALYPIEQYCQTSDSIHSCAVLKLTVPSKQVTVFITALCLS